LASGESGFDSAFDAGIGTGFIHGVASQTVSQNEERDVLQMLQRCFILSFEGCKGSRASNERELTTQAVGAELET
jgi:type VI protein secretion system component VasF